MYDHIKLTLNEPSVVDLLDNPLLEFFVPTSEKTGEQLINIKTTKYIEPTTFITIKTSSYRELTCSLHKYWNHGLHNYNDFGINETLNVFIDLSNKFGINPNTSIFQNLEFGANIILPFPVNSFLDLIISYKGKEYSLEEFKGKGKMIRFELGQYEVKIYNKGKQYNQNENILRIEIKVTTMDYFHSKGIAIHTLADLLNPLIISQLKEQLITAYDDLLIDDKSIKLDTLNNRDRETILNLRNPKYNNPENIKPDTYRKQRNRFIELLRLHGTDKKKELVFELFNSKIHQITEIPPETQININSYLSHFQSKTIPLLISYPEQTIPKMSNIVELEKEKNYPENDTLQDISLPLKIYSNYLPSKSETKEIDIISLPDLQNNETIDEICARLKNEEEKPFDWSRAIKFYKDIENSD